MADRFTLKPGSLFNAGPSPEARRYLRAKGWRPAFSYKDVWGEEHAFAFTVAKAMTMDVLRTIREALETALEDGVPYAQFQRELTTQLQALGWWGKQEMEDPATGERQLVQLGSPRRLRTIYRANLRTARAAGQWERAQRTKEALPYFVYELGPSERHRPEHAALAGLVLPIDDPFWDTHMPPNGWGCKCRVRQVGPVQLRREGLRVGMAPTVPTRTWRNNRTGEVLQVPQGIDPGWDTNPGKARQRNLERMLADKVDAMPEDLARVARADLERDGFVAED
jgi:SPP1 gp7 family putative phage head morphogenesis protein